MRDIVDLHTHTIASGHAYNTIIEMYEVAEKKGLEYLGITEHGPRMNGSCQEMYFQNLRVAPRKRGNVQMFYGVELNILDEDGTLDLSDWILKTMDIGIASLHVPTYEPKNKVAHTRSYINAMKNPYVNVIGHPDDPRFPLDYKEVVEAAKEYNVILEVNNSSLGPTSYRGNPVDSYLEMLDYCIQYQVPVVMDSDAHVDIDVGNHCFATEVIQKANFPEHLLVNTNPEILKKYLNYYLL